MRFPLPSPDALVWAGLFSLVLAFAARGAVPPAPTPEQNARLAQMVAAEPPAALAAPALSVDTSSREAVRQFYLAVASIGDDVPLGWTGRFNASPPDTAGVTSAAFKDAVLLRINALRALAGVPADVTFSDTFSAKAQQAALMESANSPKSGNTQTLSHNPPTSWRDYTADAADAAQNSNLAIGHNGTAAITQGYVADPGSNNTPVGHRRWLLLPQTQTMGTGDVPDTGSYWAANATWIFDGRSSAARPATRTPYVAWPAAGYFPAPLIFPRWSFSYPNADFTSATVTLTRDNAAVPVSVDFRWVVANPGAGTSASPIVGENTIVWHADADNTDTFANPAVTTDSVFHVKVSNVIIAGAAQSFEYDVKAFDPLRPGNDTVPVTLSGTASPVVGVANTYTATRPAFSDTLQWRTLQFDNAVPTYRAENGLDGLVATTTGTYTPRSTATVGAGTASYQLTSDSFQNQFLTAPETFYAPASGSPQLTFLSRLGFATALQTARVQVSTNDGDSWTDLYTQVGSGSGSTPTESTFTTRTVSLTSVAGLTFKVRFAYTFTGSGSAFTQADPGVGWFFDNVTFNGVQRVAAAGSPTAATAASFDFAPTTTGAVALQARGVLFGTYPMSWGPVLAVTAVNATGVAPTIATPPAAVTVTAGLAATFSVVANGTTPLSYQWLKSGTAISGATSATYTIASTTTGDAGSYAVKVTNGAGSVTSAAATLTVNAPSGPPATFANIATRAYCGVGDNVTIGGFVISGSGKKRVLIRAVGPSLTAQGIGAGEVLVDPTIEVHDATHGNVTIATNDNLADNGNAAEIRSVGHTIGATDLLQSDTTSAALLTSLDPGVYSFVVRGKNDASGIVLLEIYDADAAPSGANFANIATRAYCTSGNGVTIGGFVISGSRPKQVLMRAVGPTLATQGLGQNQVLLDPTIELHGGATVETIDNAGEQGDAARLRSTAARIGATALADTDTKSAAALRTLQPGVYSFIVRGKNDTSGIVLVEIYDAD